MEYGANIPREWRSAEPGDARVSRITPEDLIRLRGGVWGVRTCNIGLREQHTTLVHISRQANLIETANNFKAPRYLAYLPSHYRLQPARGGGGTQWMQLPLSEFPTGPSRTLNFTCMKLGDMTDLRRSWAPTSKPANEKAIFHDIIWHVPLTGSFFSISLGVWTLRQD
jgi:hypothetical protein